MTNKKDLPRKRYRAVDNKWMFRDAKVVEGAIWDSAHGWIEVTDQEVPADTLVKSGSIFEIAANKARERVWFREGTVTTSDKVLHFDLSAAGLSPADEDKLNLFGIFTLEDVATELDGVVPGSEFANANKQPTYRTLRSLLEELSGHDLKQVDAWIQSAKQIVQADPAPAPAQIASESKPTNPEPTDLPREASAPAAKAKGSDAKGV